MNINALSSTAPLSKPNQFKFNGNEEQTEFDFNVFDFNARFYDGALGRFMNIDPLADQFTAHTPYHFTRNNPISRVDPSGLSDENANGSSEEAREARGEASYQAWRANFFSKGGGNWTPSGGGCPEGDCEEEKSTSSKGVSSDDPVLKSNDVNTDWNYASFGAATLITTGLVADDVTVIGVVDDVLIPFVWIGAGGYFLYDNRMLIAKKTREIDRILTKAAGPPGFQYSLRATVSGYYPNVRGGLSWLNTGEVWKYGETTKANSRYSQGYLNSVGPGVTLVPEYSGTQVEIKVVEKTKIYGYAIRNGHLPPGNRIFR